MTSDITLEFSKIKEHASDLQTFLSLPHLISKANDEEKKVEKLGSESKFSVCIDTGYIVEWSFSVL
jgi:hypothetical protein